MVMGEAKRGVVAHVCVRVCAWEQRTNVCVVCLRPSLCSYAAAVQGRTEVAWIGFVPNERLSVALKGLGRLEVERLDSYWRLQQLRIKNPCRLVSGSPICILAPVRALSPSPCAFFLSRTNERVLINNTRSVRLVIVCTREIFRFHTRIHTRIDLCLFAEKESDKACFDGRNKGANGHTTDPFLYNDGRSSASVANCNPSNTFEIRKPIAKHTGPRNEANREEKEKDQE